MEKIYNFIAQHQLKPGDAVELMCPVAGFPKHYTVFMGANKGVPEFIANMTEGVKLVRDQELTCFLTKYAVTNIERFHGSDTERQWIVQRALTRLGEKAYSFVFNNCEHFKNWVLYGDSRSLQVTKITSGIAVGGLGFVLIGHLSNNRKLQKAGVIIFIGLLVIFVIAWLLLKNKVDNEKELI